MVFWCFPPTNKCEWSDLRAFVVQYNDTYGTSYTRKACLDIEIRDRRAPELLLESPGEIPMVIERKSVVWPCDYLATHRIEHQLFHQAPPALADDFGDGAYELSVRADWLRVMPKSAAGTLTEQIVRQILSNRAAAKMRGGVRGSTPVPWSFRPLRSDEMDDFEPAKTIRVSIDEPWSFEEPFGDSEGDEDPKAGFTHQFEIALESAARKFEEYLDNLKVLLVQFHGDGSLILDEEIVQIINAVQLPETVDQVWLAQHDWIGAHEYKVAWSRVR